MGKLEWKIQYSNLSIEGWRYYILYYGVPRLVFARSCIWWIFAEKSRWKWYLKVIFSVSDFSLGIVLEALEGKCLFPREDSEFWTQKLKDVQYFFWILNDNSYNNSLYINPDGYKFLVIFAGDSRHHLHMHGAEPQRNSTWHPKLYPEPRSELQRPGNPELKLFLITSCTEASGSY